MNSREDLRLGRMWRGEKPSAIARVHFGALWLGAVLAAALYVGSVAAAEPVSEDASSPAPPMIGEKAVVSLDTPLGALSYTPGRGLRIGSTGVTIGGFVNIKAEHEEEDGAEFTLDSLNLFLIHDYFARFRTVAELQLKDIFAADEETSGTQDFAFDVRRLYGDFSVADALHLRAGTFLTPVGRWNLILSPPLTWTTEPPLIIEETFFDATTTGLMLHGSTGAGEGRLSYSLFSQLLDPLEDDPELDPADNSAGARLEYSLGTGRAFGMTYLAADRDGEWSHLGGLHVFWQHRPFELLGEFLYQDGSGLLPRGDDEEDGENGEDEEGEEENGTNGGRPSGPQWGSYLQGVVELYHPFYLVGRYEHFDPPSPRPRLNLFTIGGVYKPLPFMALKVEYRFADRTAEDNPEGVFASFTTLF